MRDIQQVLPVRLLLIPDLLYVLIEALGCIEHGSLQKRWCEQ